MHKDLKAVRAMVQKFKCMVTLFMVIILIKLNRHISMVQAIVTRFSIYQNVYEMVFHIGNKDGKACIMKTLLVQSEHTHTQSI